ncbi:hypothetical protein CU669_16480 [Paramagnetospirillum kuznetsovii]|uniref:DUF2189 domain-containing protein n=1 Tax=Paramagnetospirillum kuznetsovii TaxID=2053833 RepID=A0A364NUX5_9PROT|nr:DUF2189 domain-containing protein [Paramagnetospirillum kuznetsovii]RAU20866.1 hypothetical protein CU669_16480 [Paramagnetospirillum kuznetsovii]
MTMPNGANPPTIRRLTSDQASGWLAAGWRDMARNPGLSLGFGAVFAVIGLVMAYGLEREGLGSLLLPACAGFVLIGPLSAVFFYEISRRNEMGEPVSLSLVVSSVLARFGQIAQLGMVLVLFMMAWLLSGLVIFAMFFQGAPPPLENFVMDILFGSGSRIFLVVGMVVGGLLAAIAFSISVFAMPMLLDRDVGAFTAMVYSVRAVRLNQASMIGWGATIAIITFFGMGFAFVGLVVSLPLVAHASWHAYRDVSRG